jgi:uncharacterized protein YkwD
MKLRMMMAAVFLAAGCAKTQAGAADPAPSASVGRVEQEVVAAVNRYREEHQLPLLRPNARIATIARRHSEEAARGETALSDGQGRLRARAVSVSMPVQTWAEDVVQGRMADADASRRLAEMLIATGRAHIENAAFEDVGVGVARDSTGRYFLTQLLILSRAGYQRP